MGRGERPGYGFCDMHCHMMPGVDDGSKDMEMSVRMMHADLADNIETVILTPHHKGGHHNVHPSDQPERIRQMVRAARADGIDAAAGGLRGGIGTADAELTLYPGNEIMYDSGVTDRLEAGRIQTLAGTSYVLVEFRPEDPFSRVKEGLRQISWAGYRIVLAHCERYDCLREDFDRVEDLWRSNVYLQINAESVIGGGPGGRRPGLFASRMNPFTRFVNQLLEEEMVSFISTDAHRDTGDRAPNLLPCWEKLSRRCDPDYLREILRENTLRLLRDEELD